MGFYAVGSSVATHASDTHLLNNRKSGNETAFQRESHSTDARLMAESYSSKLIALEYVSKDGDRVRLSMESVEYSKSIIDVAAGGNNEDMQMVLEYIKDSFNQLKKDLMDSFLKSVGIEVQEHEKNEESEKGAVLEIPAYWNAENTSQRIVDFAVAFFGTADKTADEFLSTVTAAIEEGFNQARELLGELPEQVTGLINDTYALTFEKLHQWADEQRME